jgi:glycosyltransferase involved in cell wall biosynthesis
MGFRPEVGHMRVAFVSEVTPHHPEVAGNRGARVGGLAQGLAARNHEIATFCARWWDGQGVVKTADGQDYRAVTGSPGEGFATRLPTALRRWEPDVIHAVHDDATTVLAADFGGAPLVVDWYDLARQEPTGVWGKMLLQVRRQAARVPDAVVVPSKLVETSVRELGRAADDIEVVPTGVEYDHIRSVDPDDQAEIVYSRRLDGDANLSELLLALAEFRNFDWTCAVIGDGPERSTFEAQTREMRIDDRVTFVGDRDLSERLAIFRGAHVYVHTATRAAFPTDLLRALAAGCIGIVSYHEASSAHELIETRERAFAATSPAEIAEALRNAGELEHRTIDERYAEYDRETILDRYLSIYRELRA